MGQNTACNKPQFCSLQFSYTGSSSAPSGPQNMLHAFLLTLEVGLLLMWSEKCWGAYNSYSPCSKLHSSTGISFTPVSLSWLFRTLELLWGDFAIKLNLTPSSLSWFSEPKGSHLYLFLLMIVKYVFIIIPFILPFATFYFLFAALKSFWILKLSFCILARSLSCISSARPRLLCLN